MKYLDFYNTNPKVVKALFGIKLFGSKNEDTMPELDTSNKDSIKAWQDWAVRNGHMTQEQVDTGYGTYGSKTKAAYAVATSNNSSQPVADNSTDKNSWFLSKKKANDYLNQVDSTDNLALNMSNNINVLDRFDNMRISIGNHARNQIAGRVIMPIIGALKGESDYQNKVADEVERVTAEKRAGRATQEDVDAARSKLWTTHGQRTATEAEMKQIAAILTRMNGNKPMTYEDYQRISAANGGKEWLGTDKGTGANNTKGLVKSSYGFTNEVEDSRGTLDKQFTEDQIGNDFIRGVINTGIRMWDDPNRGRFGGWAWKVDPDGTIRVLDKFEATEGSGDIAGGKNDTADYDATRRIWQRGTTQQLQATISPRQYARYVQSAMK